MENATDKFKMVRQNGDRSSHPNCVDSQAQSDVSGGAQEYNDVCPPGIATVITATTKETLFKVEASVVSIYNDEIMMCKSQTGADILWQELNHLKHVRPMKLDRSQIEIGLSILLQSGKRAEVVDIEKMRVYLYDEGRYAKISDWKHYHLPKSLLEIPAQAFEVHLNFPERLAIGDELTLLVCSSEISINKNHCGRMIYRATALAFSD